MPSRFARLAWPAAVAAGAAALVVSALLHTSPSTVRVRFNDHFVRTAGPMHAVDYVVIGLRAAGVVILLVGLYKSYRVLRPDHTGDADAVPRSGYDRDQGLRPEDGAPTSRAIAPPFL